MGKDNHHYVPQGYLRQFTINGEKSLLWEYDKEKNSASEYPKSVRHICCAHHYYAQVDNDGNIDKETVEDAFSKYVETPFSAVLNKIPTGHEDHAYLSQEEQEQLAFFVGLQFTRVPSIRNGINDFHKRIVEIVGADLIEKEYRDGNVPDVLKEEFDEKGIANSIYVEVENWVSLKPMIEMGTLSANRLLTKSWKFVRPYPSSWFVTGDNPLSYRSLASDNLLIGPFHPQSLIIMPLRKNLALLAGLPKTAAQQNFTIETLSEEETDEINILTISTASRYVYSPEKDMRTLGHVITYRNSGRELIV